MWDCGDSSSTIISDKSSSNLLSSNCSSQSSIYSWICCIKTICGVIGHCSDFFDNGYDWGVENSGLLVIIGPMKFFIKPQLPALDLADSLVSYSSSFNSWYFCFSKLIWNQSNLSASLGLGREDGFAWSNLFNKAIPK